MKCFRLAVVAAAAITGCSGATRQMQSQQMALEAAQSAFEKQDFAEADQHLTLALKDSTLRADLLEDAYLMRARARIELQNFDGAAADLEWLKDHAANLDVVYVTRSQLLSKNGDEAGAQAALAEARKLNPKIQIPTARK